MSVPECIAEKPRPPLIRCASGRRPLSSLFNKWGIAMAVTLDELRAVMRMEMNPFIRDLQKVNGITAQSARRVEATWMQTNRKLDNIGRNMARSLIVPLSGVAAALSVHEVVAYAEAWTKAKNALSVAGVAGQQQAKVLAQLFELSQANAAPLEATVQLYGRASMAAENLGASQSDLMQLTDAVGLALKVSGQSAEQASGALLQLSQALQGNKVQAEEYNSLIDGLYPLLQAAASGSQRWAGSVSKLTADVKSGKVTAQEFFRAILAGTETLRTKASTATLTLGQAYTKVSNAMMKYVGETDSNMSATQRLAMALSSLADDFDETADMALQLAGVLAAALLGRGIMGMIAKVPEAVMAVSAFSKMLRTGTLAAGAFSATLGPIGLIVGAAAGAAIAFGKWGGEVDSATRSLAAQAASAGSIPGMIDDVTRAQEAYKAAIAQTSGAQTSASNNIVAQTKREFDAKKSLLELELKRQQALIETQRATLAERGSALKAEIGDKVFTRNSAVERGFSDPRTGNLTRLPDDITGLEKTQEVIDKSPITAEIKKIRAEMELAEISATKLGDALNTTFADKGVSAGGGTASDAGWKSSKRADEYERMTKRMAEATQAIIAETQAQAALNPLMNDYGFALEKARAAHDLLNAAQQAGKTITPQLRKEVDQLATAYANSVVAAAQLSEKQDEVRRSAEEQLAFNKDLTRGIVDGFVSGAKAADIFADSLKKIGSRLLDLAFNDIFDPKSLGGSGSAGGGLFRLGVKR